MNRAARFHSASEEIHLADEEASLRILLAENDGELRRLLSVVLHRDGHEIVETRDASEMLEALAETLIAPDAFSFDAIVCAHTLPGIPGLTLLAGLRARGRAVPFILITDDAAVAEKARRLDATVIQHPFNIEAIRQ